jgi:superfamily I DNA and/or RNA helicase/predicted DNA-binding WGR domain protein
MENKILFKEFIATAFDKGEYATDDVIAFLLPLFKEVLSFHEEGKVAPFEIEETLFINNHFLDIDEKKVQRPLNASHKVMALFEKEKTAHFDIVGQVRIDTDVDAGTQTWEDLHIHLNSNTPLHTPAYLPGYSCFEIRVGHHDDQTDLFCLGLILGSMALGLNLYDPEDLKTFVSYRTNLAAFNHRIHPTVSTLITEMTELDRGKRSQDLYDVIQRLENYRDFDPEKQVDLSKVAGWKTQQISNKGQFILGKLRNRLFDTSRRNRLLYYKPNMRFVNMTVSSVPMVLHYQSIRPEHLFTWNTEIAGKVKEMKDIVLNKYLRFDDHLYLTSSLDKIRVEAQHDIQEYGFSQLKLVIAFLNWHNLKEEVQERIQSPLLLIPVELKKNKKLKEDHFVLKILANEAEVNPIVSNQLRELYGIKLPDFIDLDDTTLEAFYNKVKEQIDHANQGIVLNYVDKPKIKLVHSVAKQTVSNYKKRLRKSGSGLDSYKNIGYSYQAEHYKPLGLEIFRQRIEPRATMLEFLINDDVKISTHHLTGDKERALFEMAESEHNPYSWDFDVCNIVLGNFNYKKMSLVRDYNHLIDTDLQHTVFENLFSDQPKTYREHTYDLNDPKQWHHVITADPTQTKAILQAQTGESYIIQGPPGTGKSQTITNLIADFVAQGKNILFVCEKRAALDVVYYRLKQQGLDELCCYIHDSQSDKREFIRNLKATYEDFIKNTLNLKAIEEERIVLLEKIGVQLNLLKEYHFTNALPSEHAGMEVRRLLERLVELKEHIAVLPAQEMEGLPHYKDWAVFGETIEQLSECLEAIGAESSFSDHPFAKLREELFLSDAPASLLQRLLTDAQAILATIESFYKEYAIDEHEWGQFRQLRELISDAALLMPLAETNNLQLVEPNNEEAKQFEKAYTAYRSLEEKVKQNEAANKAWRTKFSELDLTTALAIARSQEGSFFSFFNGPWRRLKKALNDAYDFTAHSVRPTYVAVLEALQQEYQNKTALQAMAQSLASRYQLPQLDIAYLGMERIRAKRGDREVDFLLLHHEANQLVKRLHKVGSYFWQLEAILKELLHDYDHKSLQEIRDELESIQANKDTLPELLPALRKYAAVAPQLKKTVRRLPLYAESLEATIANKTLQHIYQYKKGFEALDGLAIEEAVAQIQQGYHRLLQLNARYIRAKVRHRFLQHLELSNRAISQLDEQQRAFKKTYAEGRKVLENEFGKSMRYKSIRELAGKESGQVLKDLKPVWLMSPLSVSDSLPVDAHYFDVVIFDEASQITLEEGIPSLYRASQTIIVGDDKQMPPTNFFSAKAEDPDDLEKFNTDEEEDLLGNDADSLLVQGARKLNSVMLGWHYRSRYETLISYSNHAFYGAELLTIPDRTIHHKEKKVLEVTTPEEAVNNASALFDRSISFHYQVNGLYEKRSNPNEANYIAHLVRKLLTDGVKESIGIVAFSQEQQHTIEDALTALAAEDPAFEQLLEEAYTRTENDQYVGLIVKNLENIQGDERDIIIMSICYGPDARKRMLMNFGPINKKGGEKRLNVIFSRAKKHMAVISSIKQHQITNEYNEGANYFKRFLHYAEQVSVGNMSLARTILDSLVIKKGKIATGTASIVQQQLKATLQKEGLQVDENIGQSSFKCALGIKEKAEADTYALSVLIDDENHYANTNLLEQYYQRPAILEDFGWRTITVFTKDWLHNPHKVVTQIKKRLTEDKVKSVEAKKEVAAQETVTPEQWEDRTTQPDNTTPISQYDALTYKRLTVEEGGSNKFWEVAIDGQKVVIRYGRIGTKGQTIIKSFITAEQATTEMDRLVQEKLRKGYKV